MTTMHRTTPPDATITPTLEDYLLAIDSLQSEHQDVIALSDSFLPHCGEGEGARRG